MVRYKYGYDSFKRLTDVSFDEEASVRYHYTYGNNGEVAQVEDKVLGRTIRSEYDLANRPMRKTTTDASGEIYAAEVSYDSYNNLQSFKERVAGETVYETAYEYDAENKPTKVTYSNGVEVQYLYDGLGRVTKRSVIHGTDSQETSYTYVHGAGDNTTPLICRITQLGERMLYTYDEVGNILSVEYPDRQPETIPTTLTLRTEDNEPIYSSETAEVIVGCASIYDGSTDTAKPVEDEDGKPVEYGLTVEQDTVNPTVLTGYEDGRQSNRISYRYDPLGQLIRANDPFDPTAGGKGTTWIYDYDQGGNMLSKAAYPFTEEETISEAAVHTDTYTYENADWKDQLTAYNNVPITYDTIGNPLNDGEWTYSWQHGRQLASMSKAGETVNYVYNEDGLRVQKTSTSTGTTKYTLHGKNIVHLINGNDELHFFYDAQGRVAVVNYNGASYRYMHNLQGDVIALVNDDGNKVVEYWYDAWGKPTAKNGIMSETLGKMQPFRYREYVFDEETNLYYLRSRYYRSEWGRFVNADKLLKQSSFAYCRCSPVRYSDRDGQFEADAYTITQEYYEYLEKVYDYSIAHEDDPLVIPVDIFDENIIEFAESGYTYDQYPCAYSIAECLKPAKSATGMTHMQRDYAVATISIKDAGGEGEHLLDYSILAMFDPSRRPPKKPWHHGGILISYPVIYESCSSHGFGMGSYADQNKAGGWTHMFWHKGVKLSGKLLQQVKAILYSVIDNEE